MLSPGLRLPFHRCEDCRALWWQEFSLICCGLSVSDSSPRSHTCPSCFATVLVLPLARNQFLRKAEACRWHLSATTARYRERKVSLQSLRIQAKGPGSLASWDWCWTVAKALLLNISQGKSAGPPLGLVVVLTEGEVGEGTVVPKSSTGARSSSTISLNLDSLPSYHLSVGN